MPGPELWRDRHAGEPGYVLCNGHTLPSRLSRLDGKITIGVNRSVFIYRSTYLAVLDKGWFEGDARVLIEQYGERLWTRPNRLPEAIVVRPSPRKVFWSDDLGKWASMRWAGIFALQVAVWMGLSPIFVLGMDGSGKRFDGSQVERVKMARSHDAAIRHVPQRVRVYTCTRPEESLITSLPYMSYDDAVEETWRKAVC